MFVAMLFASAAVAGGLVVAVEDQPSREVWSYGGRVSHTLLHVYAMRMAAVFVISTTTITARLGSAPRWLTVLGFATGACLLLSAGLVPWIELVFPGWVFVLSVHILVTSFGSPGLRIRSEDHS